MTGARIAVASLLLLIVLVVSILTLRPHFLTHHGRVTCGGELAVGARVYRSQSGDLFIYAPNIDIQIAVVSPKGRDLGRCNTPAFKPVLGFLFSREAEPRVQCTAMWKGGGSNDIEPPHVVTETYAEFPWGSCPKLRIEY